MCADAASSHGAERNEQKPAQGDAEDEHASRKGTGRLHFQSNGTGGHEGDDRDGVHALGTKCGTLDHVADTKAHSRDGKELGESLVEQPVGLRADEDVDEDAEDEQSVFEAKMQLFGEASHVSWSNVFPRSSYIGSFWATPVQESAYF
jgi:hypothetical protein